MMSASHQTASLMTATPSSSSEAAAAAADARFSCNICLDAVTEPVVTQCGHLYCWPCLFRWLEPGMLPGERQSLGISSTAAVFAINETRRVCPVCKAPCSVPSLVPVYVRTHTEDMPSSNEEKEGREALPLPEQVSTPPQTPTPIEAGSDVTLHDSTMEHELEASTSIGHTSGLRQRRGARREEARISGANSSVVVDRSDSNSTAAVTTPVPARPPANSPTRTPNYAPSASSSPYPTTTAAPPPRSAVAMTPNNTLAVGRIQPPVFPGGSSGLARTFQQALTAAVVQSQQQQPPPRQGTGGGAYQGFSAGGIPPLHRREGHGNAAAAASASSTFLQPDSLGDPDATEFLSRILLLLGSFVILCLLLF